MRERSDKGRGLVQIHFSYYIMAFGYVMGGYFLNLIVFTCLVFVHEFGHCLAAFLCRIPIKKVVIYPFGGKSILNGGYNQNIHLELFVASFGVIFQFLFYLIICFFYKKYFIRTYVMDLFTLYHREIILFNLLPIYPLDGGRILQLLFCFVFPYRLANDMTIILSFVNILLFFFVYRFNYANVMIVGVLLFYLYEFFLKRRYIYQRFLLERYLNSIHYSKVRIVKDIYLFYRNCTHYVKRGEKMLEEQEVLRKFYRKR